MKKQPLWVFIAVLSLIAGVSAFSQTQVLTPELIVTTRWIGQADLSPDGTSIIFQAGRPRTEAEKPGKAIDELWMIPVSGGEPKRFA
ncbi:MAG: hypothetical protein HYW57_04865, partial [Ignavibacteriales bacterium]|nr:hypothetical protein [Ignavibacteriales bacterium]